MPGIFSAFLSPIYSTLYKLGIMTPPHEHLSYLLFHTNNVNAVTLSLLRENYVDHSDNNLLYNCVVTRIDHCKEKTAPFHEYIVAHISRKTSARGGHLTDVGCIRVERRIQARSETSSLTTVSATSHSSSPSSPTTPASDTARVYNTTSKSEVSGVDDIPLSYTFSLTDPDACPSIAQLIAAGLTAGHDQPNYDVIQYQCYWYAGVVFELLTEGAATSDAAAGTYPPHSPRSAPPRSYGNHGVRIVSEQNIQKVARSLRPAYLDMAQEIDKRVATKRGGESEREALRRQVQYLEAQLAGTSHAAGSRR